MIKEKKDDCNSWMWAVFGIIFFAIVLTVVGMCLSRKQCQKAVYMGANTSMPPSVASSLQGGGGLRSSAMSVAPVTYSMLNSASPMSFMSY